MADVLLGSIGGAVGSSIGGSVAGISASQIGSAIGSIAGALLNNLVIYPALFGDGGSDIKTSVTIGTSAGAVTAPSANYGTPIPVIAGPNLVRLAGTLIYMSQIQERTIEETVTTVSKRSGGKGGGGSSKVKSTTFIQKYEYFGSFAFAFCKGPAVINRIWANGKLLSSEYISEAVSTYTGSETQYPNYVIGAGLGYGNTTAYRGIVYAVFSGVNLDPFGNRVPEVQAEIQPSITTLSGLIGKLLETAGFSTSDYVIDGAVDTAIDFKTVIINATASLKIILQELANIFGFYITEVDGKIFVGSTV